jgi:DNA-binding MurR/RpiR family transcriptional regulator
MRKERTEERMYAHSSETIGEEVRERLGQMTPAERRVARALLATYPSAGLESLPQLAESAGVTGPTVLRFVRKVGFDGYPDFQRSLRREVQARSEGLSSLYETRAADGSDLLGQSHGAFLRALDSTLRSASLQDELDGVVGLLTDVRRKVWFAGGRFSHITATYLALQLRMLRSGCAIVDQEPTRRIEDAMEIRRRDVVCVFDYRRYQSDTVHVADRAIEQGAALIVFTDPWLSPAAERARHVLISHADSASPFDSLLGAFALTEVIAAHVVAVLGDRGLSRINELESMHGVADGGR